MKRLPEARHLKPKEQFRTLVEQRGAHLRHLRFTELQRLTDEPVEYLEVQGRRGRIGLIVLQKPSGRIQVVVQGFLKHRFVPLIWDVALDGFYKNSDETVEAMEREEFYDFD